MPHSLARYGAERPTTFLVQACSSRVSTAGTPARQAPPAARPDRLEAGCPSVRSSDLYVIRYRCVRSSASFPSSSLWQRGSCWSLLSQCLWHGGAPSLSPDLAEQFNSCTAFSSLCLMTFDLRHSLARAQHFCRKQLHTHACTVHNDIMYRNLRRFIVILLTQTSLLYITDLHEQSAVTQE